MLKHRLVAGIVLMLFVSGCAAGRAFRKGDEAARAGDWDTAVQQYSRAVQEKPERAEYKIALERATQDHEEAVRVEAAKALTLVRP